MAFVLPFVGYYIYKFVKERFNSKGGETAAIILGSYFGIVVASLCAAVEFGVQPLLFTDAAGQPLYCPYGLAVSIPAMVIPHLAVAGPVEVLFTLLIVTFVKKVSPEMIDAAPAKKTKGIWGLVLALICLTPLGLLASGTAWGEWGPDEISGLAGYTPKGMTSGLSYSALLPDYSVSGLPEVVGYVISAILGVAILVIIFKLLGDRRSGSAAQAK